MVKSLIVFVLFLGLLPFGLKALFFVGKKYKIQFNYPSRQLYKIAGLDVSHHQKEIDWKKIDSKKYSFVYIKATEGGDFKDPLFQKNYQEAKKQGILVGGYHFWSFCRDRKDQIDNIINTIPHETGTLVPALDIESLKECDGVKIKDRLVDDLRYANETIKAAYGKAPIIYTTNEFAENHPEIFKFKNPLWMRSLIGPPMGYEKGNWSIWQFYSAGKVEGITGLADLNVAKSRSAISKLKLGPVKDSVH